MPKFRLEAAKAAKAVKAAEIEYQQLTMEVNVATLQLNLLVQEIMKLNLQMEYSHLPSVELKQERKKMTEKLGRSRKIFDQIMDQKNKAQEALQTSLREYFDISEAEDGRDTSVWLSKLQDDTIESFNARLMILPLFEEIETSHDQNDLSWLKDHWKFSQSSEVIARFQDRFDKLSWESPSEPRPSNKALAYQLVELATGQEAN